MCFLIRQEYRHLGARFETRFPQTGTLAGEHGYRHQMRPFTAIVVIGLLVLIVGAFVAKLVATGLTP